MRKLKHLMAITGSILAMASCQNANNENDALNNVAEEQSTVDTIPKRSDTMQNQMMGDSTHRMGDTTSPRYVDLRTGQPVDLYYDPKARRTYSVVTNEPVDFYVDMNTGDTVYGQGRFVVNNYITRSDAGMYKLNADKVKMDKDEIKIKEGNRKFKMDNSIMKLKEGDMKMKVDTTTGKIKKNMEGNRSKTRSY